MRAVEEMGFTKPSAIQAAVIPLMLSGKDCLALAPTGSGKTCAFGIPVVNGTDPAVKQTQTLILCPTRELAMQTHEEFKKLTKFTEGISALAVFGGQHMQRQLQALKRNPQIVVGTPGRLLDHLRRRTLKLDAVKTVILDEADEMLNMGFLDDIKTVLSKMPPVKQVALFSATMSKEIRAISVNFQNDPQEIHIESAEEKPDIAQFRVNLKEASKTAALTAILQDKGYERILVFCNTKRKVDLLSQQLSAANLSAEALHGDLIQRQRDAVMRCFRGGQLRILVATDVAARGIDVNDIDAVFNYDVPQNDEYYVHRIGRTARASKSGAAYSFVTASDNMRMKQIERYAGAQLQELVLGGLSETRAKQKSTTRCFINLGTKDGFNEQTLTQFICTSAGIGDSEVAGANLLDTFSFIEAEASAVAKILDLSGSRYGKRTVAVEVAGTAGNRDKNKNRGKNDRKDSFGKGDGKSGGFGKNDWKGNESRGGKGDGKGGEYRKSVKSDGKSAWKGSESRGSKDGVKDGESRGGSEKSDKKPGQGYWHDSPFKKSKNHSAEVGKAKESDASGSTKKSNGKKGYFGKK